jgi:hypothetical protein
MYASGLVAFWIVCSNFYAFQVLHVEQEMDDIAIFDDIFFTFRAQ